MCARPNVNLALEFLFDHTLNAQTIISTSFHEIHIFVNSCGWNVHLT